MVVVYRRRVNFFLWIDDRVQLFSLQVSKSGVKNKDEITAGVIREGALLEKLGQGINQQQRRSWSWLGYDLPLRLYVMMYEINATIINNYDLIGEEQAKKTRTRKKIIIQGRT